MLFNRSYKSLFFFFSVIFILCCSTLGIAEELPGVTINVRPETLIAPSEITLSFTIENTTGSDCANFYISTSDGLISEPLGSLASGDSISFNRRHSVTEKELSDESIAYIFSYDNPEDPDRKINFTVETPIKRAESYIDCEFTREFSSDSVSAGDTVTILYTVRNTGNTPIESLRITDTLGDFTGRIETLNVGEGRSLISRITLTEPAVSSAQLVYETPDGPRTVEYEDREISITESELLCGFNIESDPEHTGAVVGILSLQNTGNSDLTNIIVTDDFSGRVIAEGAHLAAGEKRVLKQSFYPCSENIRWRVIATASNETTIDTITDTVSPVESDKTDPADVTFLTEAVTPRLKHNGTAVIRFEIRNNGNALVRSLKITESTLGIVKEFATIAASGIIDRTCNIPIEGDTELNFALDYTDEDGWQYTVESAPINIVISADGIDPVDAPSSKEDFSGRSVHINGSSMFAVMLSIGVLLLIGLTVALIVLSHRERVRKQVRKALQKQSKGQT